MDRAKNASRNIIWGIINTVIMVGLPFLSRTVLIYVLGIRYVGLGSLFTSILGVLSFAELGIGSALVYGMYEPVANSNDAKVCALLNLYKKSYRIIGAAILLIGVTIMPFLEYLIADEAPAEINIYLLFAIYLLDTVIGYFTYSYRTSLLVACQRVDIQSKVGLVTAILIQIFQVGILLWTENYYFYILVIPIVTLTNNILIAVLTKRIYPQYICKGKVGRDELNIMKQKVGGMLFQKIGNVVLSSVDTIVISSFLGLTILGIYNSYYYIIMALFRFFSAIQSAMIPSVGNSIAKESKEKNWMDFKKFHFIYTWLTSWFTVCLLCLYQPFMELWVGQDLMLANEMVILFSCYFFFYKWLDMTYIYREACGLWWEGKIIPLTAAAVNLTINLVLVSTIGLAGILISTIISLIFVYDIGNIFILYKYQFKEYMVLGKFYVKQLLFLACAAISCIGTYFVCTLVEASAILELIFRIPICIVVPNAIFFLIFSRTAEYHSAKEFMLNNIQKLIRKESGCC